MPRVLGTEPKWPAEDIFYRQTWMPSLLWEIFKIVKPPGGDPAVFFVLVCFVIFRSDGNPYL